MDDAADDRSEFATSYEEAAGRLTSSIERACRSAEDWPRGVRAAVEATLALMESEPALGRQLLLEPHEADRTTLARQAEARARLEGLLREGRKHAPSAELPDTLEQSLLGSASFIVGRQLRAGAPQRSRTLTRELTALLLSPYFGRDEAERLADGE